MTHRIQQQYLYVELNGTESDGLALQSRLSDLCSDWLSPALERVLDRLAPPDAHLYLERLEIDAGILSLDRLEYDLAAEVASAVEKAIREQAIPDEAGQVTTSSFFETASYKSEQQKALDAFLYFLETGRLPWSFRLPTGETLESLVSAQALNQADLIRIKKTIDTNNVQERLGKQFSTAFLLHLLTQLSPEGQTNFQAMLSKLQPSDLSKETVKYLEKTSIALIIRRVAKGELLAEDNIVAALSQDWKDLKWIENIKPISENTPYNDVGFSEQEETQGIYIDNAGLVLLHPFLPMFFEALGIAAQDQLLQPERALCLLHFLTTGQTTAPEYELVLPKILCNLPLETPVAADIELTASEKEEGEALLAAVIRHWDTLRDTSPDGLRGTFLCRAGKISRRDERNCLLQVERKSYDILLDQLPWGISMIKLPWMEQMLWVEWN